MTMGAMLRFKRETGREVSEMDEKSLSDLMTLLWCCVASASRADNLSFSYSLEDFCDKIDPEDMERMQSSIYSEPKRGDVGEALG